VVVVPVDVLGDGEFEVFDFHVRGLCSGQVRP
jgi:hypothetical protein